jgi:hypothetical protein
MVCSIIEKSTLLPASDKLRTGIEISSTVMGDSAPQLLYIIIRAAGRRNDV